jgi:hypothetical protein
LLDKKIGKDEALFSKLLSENNLAKNSAKNKGP